MMHEQIHRLMPLFEILAGCFFAFYAVKTMVASHKGCTKERYPAVQVAGVTSAALGAWLVAITHIPGLPRAFWLEVRFAGLIALITALIILTVWIALYLIERWRDK